jgi:1-acyl-sn-glycerol-3-phosphate acyltransferase
MSDRAKREYSPTWRRVTTTAFPPLIRALMKRDWHGREHIPREGGVIVAANHLSYVDWAAVALFVYESGRYPAFLIKSSVFDVRGVGAFLRACGQFPVQRGHVDAALVLREAERGVRKGECLVIYPEGTATRDPDLWPMVAKTGVARLALNTGAPVIPLAHWGAQDILAYGSRKPHLFPRRTVQMMAGPPVDLSAYLGQPLNRDVLRAATRAVMSDITALVARMRDEPAPAVPYDRAAARRAAQEASADSAGDAEAADQAATGKTAGEDEVTTGKAAEGAGGTVGDAAEAAGGTAASGGAGETPRGAAQA